MIFFRVDCFVLIGRGELQIR